MNDSWRAERNARTMSPTERITAAVTIGCAQLPWLGLYLRDNTLVFVGAVLTALGAGVMLRLWLRRIAALEGGAWGVLRSSRWSVLIAALTGLAIFQIFLLLTVYRPR